MISVAVAILQRDDGRVLVVQRRPGTFRAGHWEFPGGKLESGENSYEALIRELREELGVTVGDARHRMTLRHRYPEKDVLLDVWQVRDFTGPVRSCEGHELKWAKPPDLVGLQMLEADWGIVSSLNLPATYLITPPTEMRDGRPNRIWLSQLEKTLVNGVAMMQLRDPVLSGPDFIRLAELTAQRCEASSTRLLLNGSPDDVLSLARAIGAAGIHVPSMYLGQLDSFDRPAEMIVGASCHSARELRQIATGNADFCVLGPVLPTDSHPERSALGWARFSALIREVNVPVYALGGLAGADVERAWEHGAQGVAGSSGFWVG